MEEDIGVLAGVPVVLLGFLDVERVSIRVELLCKPGRLFCL